MKDGYLKKYCTGCGLCNAYMNIEYETDEKGFITPVLDDDEKINFCKKICPNTSKSFKMQSENLWGHYQAAYLGYAKDEEIRYHASSGGVITAICSYLLREKKVDGVLHIGVSEDRVYGTRLYCSTTKNQLIQRSGSRYCISSPLKNLKNIVESEKKYVFVGKPCDIIALKNYMQEDEELRKQIIVTLSFFCAGMPSDTANKKLIETLLGNDAMKCKTLNYRGDGWPGFAMATDANGNCKKIEYETSWGKILGRDVKYCCRFCTDGIGEMADISCGDGWYLNEDNKPDFEEKDGRNIIFARTNLGKEILHSAQSDIQLSKLENTEEIGYMQPYQKRRKATMYWKILALRLFFRKLPPYDIKKLYYWQRQAKWSDRMKEFLGTIKRVLKNVI